MARSLVGTNNKEEIAKFELGGGGNGKGFKSTAEQKALAITVNRYQAVVF